VEKTGKDKIRKGRTSRLGEIIKTDQQVGIKHKLYSSILNQSMGTPKTRPLSSFTQKEITSQH
jgi:hypothetical protein